MQTLESSFAILEMNTEEDYYLPTLTTFVSTYIMFVHFWYKSNLCAGERMRGIHMITSNTLTGILGTNKKHRIMLGLLASTSHFRFCVVTKSDNNATNCMILVVDNKI